MSESPASGSPSGPSGGAGKANVGPSHAGGGQDPLGSDPRAKTMEEAWEDPRLARLRDQIEKLDESDADWTWDELRYWCRKHKRLKESTWKGHRRQLRFMATYEDQPVIIDGTRSQLVRSFYLYFDYREDHDDNAGPGALKNDIRAVKLLGSFLGIPDNVWPTQPKVSREQKKIPPPEAVSEMLHWEWTPNPRRKYRNGLVRYFLFFSFMLGLRSPSELYQLSVHDINLDRGTIVVTEPKKGNERRTVYVEPERLMDGHKNYSVEKWLHTWRPKCDPETDALFPQPDGTAYSSKFALRQGVMRVVDRHPEFSWVHPYLGRHWSVNARLIDWDFDYDRVANWHGHESVDRTRNSYESGARVLKKSYDDNWLMRALRSVNPGRGVFRNLSLTSYEQILTDWVSPQGEPRSGPVRI